MIEIRKAQIVDLKKLDILDRHISFDNLQKCIKDASVYVVTDNDRIVGWARYGLFFDMYPFLNMIYFLDEYRRVGLGTKLMNIWENDMKDSGYNLVMTSIQADEGAQHFYRKRGFFDIGGFTFPGQVALEVLLVKKLEIKK